MSMNRSDNRLVLESFSCVGSSFVLVPELNFSLNSGNWLALVGPNGSGKTTLLRSIVGLTLPRRGNVLWSGKSTQSNRLAWQAEFLYQGHLSAWKEACTLWENLSFQASLDSGDISKERLAGALSYVGLSSKENSLLGFCSAGERRRLSLARLFLSSRPIWFLDEPSASLDASASAILAQMIDTHLGKGGIALVVTHQAINCVTRPYYLELPRARFTVPDAVSAFFMKAT